MRVEGARLYSLDGRAAYLGRISQPAIAHQLRGLYQLLDAALSTQKQAKRQMLRLGQRYPEIKEFQKMPGVGLVGAHLFDGFVQTPRRFFGQAEALALLRSRHPQ